jgi:hypothetical protein
MMLPPFNRGLLDTILNWYGMVALLAAPLVIIYYLYRLNRAANPWRFSDMLTTKNRDGVEKADLSKFGSMIALVTGAAVVIFTSINHSAGDSFVTIFITFIGVFSGVQVANGALRVLDNKNVAENGRSFADGTHFHRRASDEPETPPPLGPPLGGLERP